MAEEFSSGDEREEVTIPDKMGDPYWRRKLKLINEIKKSVGTTKQGKKCLNILVIGTQGCGKSSFINSVLTSFREDYWTLYSSVGSGFQITQHFKSFPADKTYYTEQPNVLLPTFIDINGLENSNDDFNKAFLEAVFDGKIKELEKISRIKEIFENEKDRPDNFRRHMAQRPEYLKVDRIVVVASADTDTPLPTNLFDCINEVANNAGGIPIFGIMTKKDKVQGNQQLSRRIKDFIGHIGITMDSFELIENYCYDIDRHRRYRETVFPYIDVPILSFIKQVINSHLGPDKTYDEEYTHPHRMERVITDIILKVQILILTFIVLTLPTGEQNNRIICEAYQKLSKYLDFTVPRIDTLCVKKGGIGFLYIKLLLQCIILCGILIILKKLLRLSLINWACVSLFIICMSTTYYYHNAIRLNIFNNM